MAAQAEAGLQGAAVPKAVGLANPTLAFGLTGLSNFSTEKPFLNIARVMRPWFGQSKGKWNAMTTEQLRAGGYLDDHGWLKKMPPGLTGVSTIWAWEDNSLAGRLAARLQAGNYVVTYKGTGTIEAGLRAKVVQSRPGRVLISNPTGGRMVLTITSTDPQGTGDYIRDITVVPQKYEALYQAGEIFNPDWLSLIENARELRFMDWMNTNGETSGSWSDRPTMSDATWAQSGVPIEVMVQLANQVGSDPWFNMPVRASDDYIRQFATYVRDHLDPRLVAHVEYGNENWNWAFKNTTWLANQAKTDWNASGGATWVNYAAFRATKAALIWDKVFGDAAQSRLDNVLAIQTANPAITKQELEAPLWKQHDPSGYVAPNTVFNSLAVTTYFGGAMLVNPELRDALIAQIKSGSAARAGAWLTAQMTDPKVNRSIPQIEKQWAAQKAIADEYKLKLVAYEGGQHIQQAFRVKGLTKQDLDVLTDFLTSYIRSPEMATLYQTLWNAWAKVSDGPFMQYTDVGQPSKWGSWGLYAALGDANPRAQLLNDLNKSQKAWFGNGGGPQYQQGVIRIAGNGGETLTGTDKQDFLVGGQGDDTLVPGKGKDGLNGGPGTNTVVLPGAADQYKLVAEGAGYRLTGPGVSDYVINIQKFRFDTGGEKTLEQMLKG